MTKNELFEEFRNQFEHRRFVAGLLVSMIDLLSDLGVPSRRDISSYDQLLSAHPRQETTAAGRRANTLILARNGGTVSLRPFYNDVEKVIRVENKRFDYPSCAPHATQAWGDYLHWIDALCALSREAIKTLRAEVIDFVLNELPSQEFIPGSIKVDPPIFRDLLDGFDFSSPKGEPSGAAFQGAVFGFIRADNLHLQVEIDKVRTGSKRRQKIGDIDAWDGERLAITAEVKNFSLKGENVEDLKAFANAANQRGAIGMVVGQTIDEEAQEELVELGIRPLTMENLIQIVDLWDPSKQAIAVESMMYYAVHVERNSVLIDRLREFISEIESPGS